MNKKSFILKCFLSSGVLVSSLSFSACMPNSAIPTMFTLSNPGIPVDPTNPTIPISNPGGNPSGETPNTPNPNNPNNGNTVIDHPAPPDVNQPQTEDDFWKLMQRFGFMQKRTKNQLLVDIKAGVARKITDWSPGQVRDKTKNILAKYKDADTKKYMNPYPKTVEEYTAKSLSLAKRAPQSVDFYIDVEYGAKDGSGRINMQRVDPKTFEIVYFNASSLITNYTQTRLPASGPPPLLRLTHFIFVPPTVYN